MASPITDTSNLTQPVNVIFQRQLLNTARQNCPYFAGVMPAVIQQNQGSFTASWRRIENLSPSTSAITELNTNVAFPTRTSIQPTTTNVQATLGKYGQYLVLSEEVDLINFNGQDARLVRNLSIAGGRSLNQLQRNEEEDNSTAILANAATTTTAINSKVTKTDIRKAVNALNRNSAMKFMPMLEGSGNFNTTPVRASYMGICHPDVEEDIRDMAGFIPVEDYASQTSVQPGEFGAVNGVRFVTSEDSTISAEGGGANTGVNLRSSGNSKVDVYKTVIYGEEAFGSVGLGTGQIKEIYKAGDDLPGMMLIRKARGSAGAADPLDELSTMGYKTWHAARVLNTNWSRCILSGATDYS